MMRPFARTLMILGVLMSCAACAEEPPPTPPLPPCPPERKEALRNERNKLREEAEGAPAGISFLLQGEDQMDAEELKEYEREETLNQKARELAERIQEVRAGKKTEEAQAQLGKLKAELGNVLEEQFYLRDARRLLELKELEKRVAQLKEALEKRKERKGEIIDRRLRQMAGEEDEEEEW